MAVDNDMTYTRIAGDEQHYRWLQHAPSVQDILDLARTHITAEQFDAAHRLLAPLVENGNPEALYLGASHGLMRVRRLLIVVI